MKRLRLFSIKTALLNCRNYWRALCTSISGKAELYIVVDGHLSRREILFNISNASKGPSVLLAYLREGLVGMSLKHKIIQLQDIERFANQSREKYFWILSHGNVAEVNRSLDSLKGYPVLIGPNVAMSRGLVERLSGLSSSTSYLVPSIGVKNALNQKFPQSHQMNVSIWPVGINTNAWRPNEKVKRNKILVYIKGKLSTYEKTFLDYLKEDIQNLEVVVYGEYNKADFCRKLNESLAALWFASLESQGIAFLESWAMGVPTLIRVKKGNKVEDQAFSEQKYCPYLSQECGDFLYLENIFVKDKTKVEHFLGLVHEKKFNSRSYVERNFSSVARAREAVLIFDSIREHDMD